MNKSQIEKFISHATIFVIGCIFGLMVPWYLVEHQAITQPDAPRPVMMAEDESPLTADGMADWLAPKVRDFCEKNKETWVADSGGWTHQLAVKMVWPWGMKQIPKGTKAIVTYTNDRLSKLTVGQLMQYLENHIRENGGDPNESPFIRKMKASEVKAAMP